MESIAQKAARGITVWAQDERTEIEIGINRSGELFLGNSKSGYNLLDTQTNRDYIQTDFQRITGIAADVPAHEGPDDPTEPEEDSVENW